MLLQFFFVDFICRWGNVTSTYLDVRHWVLAKICGYVWRSRNTSTGEYLIIDYHVRCCCLWLTAWVLASVIKVKVRGFIQRPIWQASRPQGAQTWITQFNLQTTPCLPLAFVCVHQMALPRTVAAISSCNLLLIYRPRKDERLSWPSLRTYSGLFTHISGYPSAAFRAQDRESLPAKDQHSTTAPRNQDFQPVSLKPLFFSVSAWMGDHLRLVNNDIGTQPGTQVNSAGASLCG